MRLRDYVTGRVLAWLVIALLAGWFGIGKAHAQADTSCSDPSKQCTPAQAYSACMATITWYAQETNRTNPHCVIRDNVDPATSQFGIWDGAFDGGNFGAHYWATFCPAGTQWDQNTHTCTNPSLQCLAQGPTPVVVNASVHPNLTTYCKDGCIKTFTSDGDPARVVTEGPNIGAWLDGVGTPTGGTCTAEEETPIDEEGLDKCPAGKKQLPDGSCAEQGDCPVGMHKVQETGSCAPDGACPTGQQKAPDGSCVAEQCPTGFAKKKDGTCGLDENNDGNPDDEEDGNDDGSKASGGETCDSPPACSGDPILCLQTKIQWRIDCNTRKQRNVTGGACSSPPVCTGEKCDALEYSSLMMQWRAACALEKLGSGAPGGGQNGDANRNGVPDVMEGNIGEQPGADPDSVVKENSGEALWDSIDSDGFLGGGSSCPAGDLVLQIGSYTKDLSEVPCQHGAAFRALLLGLAYAIAAFTIAAAARGQ